MLKIQKVNPKKYILDDRVPSRTVIDISRMVELKYTWYEWLVFNFKKLWRKINVQK